MKCNFAGDFSNIHVMGDDFPLRKFGTVSQRQGPGYNYAAIFGEGMGTNPPGFTPGKKTLLTSQVASGANVYGTPAAMITAVTAPVIQAAKKINPLFIAIPVLGIAGFLIYKKMKKRNRK
jgi:hypothetical protein